MTIEEAITDIKENIKPSVGGKSLEMAIEALEKQIPKQALETQELIEIEFICPECKCTNEEGYKYCWNCGQSLKY